MLRRCSVRRNQLSSMNETWKGSQEKASKCCLPHCHCPLLRQWAPLSTKPSEDSEASPLEECWQDEFLICFNGRHVCDQIEQIPEESFSWCIYDICALSTPIVGSDVPSKAMSSVWIEDLTLRNPNLNSRLHQWTNYAFSYWCQRYDRKLKTAPIALSRKYRGKFNTRIPRTHVL